MDPAYVPAPVEHPRRALPLTTGLVVTLALVALGWGRTLVGAVALHGRPGVEVGGLVVADSSWAHRWRYGLQSDGVVTVTAAGGVEPGWTVVNVDRPHGEPVDTPTVRALATVLLEQARGPGFSGGVQAYLRHDDSFGSRFHRLTVGPQDLPALERLAAGGR